ncbi:MAG: cyclic nucleotide-binding domain-containing protein [Thermodesulfobacteriota bacterium]
MSKILNYCKDLQQKNFDSDQLVLEEGGRSNKIFILIEGEVSVEKNGIKINTVSEPGAIFGEMSILLDLPHTANVRAKSPSKFFVAENGLEFLKSDIEISFFMSKLLASRLNGVSTYLVDIKKQYEEFEDNHFSMVDTVLSNLLNSNQDEDMTLGSERVADDTK